MGVVQVLRERTGLSSAACGGARGLVLHAEIRARGKAGVKYTVPAQYGSACEKRMERGPTRSIGFFLFVQRAPACPAAPPLLRPNLPSSPPSCHRRPPFLSLTLSFSPPSPDPSLAYSFELTWNDGTKERLSRRERPQVLMVGGKPSVLFTGAKPQTGFSYTLAQRIAT